MYDYMKNNTIFDLHNSSLIARKPNPIITIFKIHSNFKTKLKTYLLLEFGKNVYSSGLCSNSRFQPLSGIFAVPAIRLFPLQIPYNFVRHFL